LAADAKDDTTTVGRLKAAGGGTLQLIVDYVKQETLQPLKGLGRFVLFGIVGSVALAVGLIILAVAFLRVLQGETGTTFAGNWSWAPYLICTVALVVVAVVAVAAVQRGQARRQLEPESKEHA
jgi:hypothetical protein